MKVLQPNRVQFSLAPKEPNIFLEYFFSVFTAYCLIQYNAGAKRAAAYQIRKMHLYPEI